MAGVTLTADGHLASGTVSGEPEQQQTDATMQAGTVDVEGQADEKVVVCDGVRIVSMTPSGFQRRFIAQK